MMPAQGRQGAPRLPSVDEATVPFSALFDNNRNFDRATVEATVQFADSSIFVASDGRRYLFKSLPDDNFAPALVPSPPRYSTPTSSRQAQAQQLQFGSESQSPSQSPPPASISLDDHSSDRSSSSIRRRPVSISSPYSYTNGGRPAQDPQAGAAVPGVDPDALTRDATSMMGSLNINRFSATPLFAHSDGGVQAAEALTESYPGRGDDETSPSSPTPRSASYQIPPTTQSYTDANAPHLPVFGNPVVDFDYGNYMAQANYQALMSRQPVSPTGPRYESLMEHSNPIYVHVPSDEYSPWGAISPEKELAEVQTHGDYRPVAARDQASPLEYQPNYVDNGRTYHQSSNFFDTQTPIVVHQTQRQTSSTSSDSRSTNRDNVLPGEDLLFDGPVKSAETITSPVFLDGLLKVFRNTITHDLRFHCKVGNDSETFWMKANKAQLVPIYAYDPRFPNVVYIRDNEIDKGKNSYMQVSQGSHGQRGGIYKFDRLNELCDFQEKLTAEKVVLDITSVKLVRLSKANSRSSNTYSSVRLQIWHEAQLRKSSQSDALSFVTAGTALSGPLRERLVPSSSRLMIYLGRLGEYIDVFITDDIEVKAEGETMVKLKARKAGAFSKKGSRWPGIKAHIEPKHGSEPAGLDIHGQAPNVDIESTFDLYKTFEIEFENSPSQDNFLRKWDEVMRERRAQRKKLDQIREDMEGSVFTGRTALSGLRF
ncbi:hypothetical protein B0T22DRAFT_292562 [Podospora appendiculata]|uniref:Uncharacterized protein n=1 Tax=Podospora appendiculata TaxID=314037 RepID=A0AAE1C8E6_9PEZI|nr:hypothetical protein B0T22DRAFT_292562 [Podospora appendiculata]